MSEYTPHEQDPTLLEAFHYINQVPGKDIRGKLIDAFQRWFRIPDDKVVSIKELIGELHNASLLIDDIEDDSTLRRGIPVAHSIYGTPTTINCANYVYFLALERCHRLGNPEAMNVFVLELLNLHRGQGQDIFWRDNLRCPTEEEYERMVLDKTGGLFRLAVGLMQAFSSDDNPCRSMNFTPLVDKLALYFQIRDDLVNLASADYMTSKSFCEDLTEGKFSFPIIHTIRSKPNDNQLLNILKKHTDSIPIKKYAVEHMEKCGSFAYTQAKLHRLHAEVLASIESMGGHRELSALVEYLHLQVRQLNCGGTAVVDEGESVLGGASSAEEAGVREAGAGTGNARSPLGHGAGSSSNEAGALPLPLSGEGGGVLPPAPAPAPAAGPITRVDSLS